MAAYYNEWDAKTAAWLRELIKAGLIADGEVDERSITDVQPGDLVGFTQCHFFAGIGGWSYALRLAGWPDDRAVWTGSCPCQPFSSAGKGAGANDSRDLWPTWFGLIQECRPSVVFGEQVASADGLGWIDRVSADVEAADYAIGAVDYCAPGLGAFHIRQRLWFVAKSHREQLRTDRPGRAGESTSAIEGKTRQRQRLRSDARQCSATRPLDDAECVRTGRSARSEGCAERSTPSGRQDEGRRELQIVNPSALDVMGNSNGSGYAFRTRQSGNDGETPSSATGKTAFKAGAAFWSDVEWIACTDGKSRPVEPGTFPLAHGVPARVGRLRGYGNAIVPQVAAEVIGAYMDLSSAHRG